MIVYYERDINNEICNLTYLDSDMYKESEKWLFISDQVRWVPIKVSTWEESGLVWKYLDDGSYAIIADTDIMPDDKVVTKGLKAYIRNLRIDKLNEE